MQISESRNAERRAVVLVVDDENNFRRSVVRQLQAAGFDTIEARDGSEAVYLFAEHNREIDAVLLDLVMPVTNGREALTMLRYYAPSLPIVLTSGYRSAEAASIQQEERLVGFLPKPFDRTDLAREVRRVIEEREKNWDTKITPPRSLRVIANARNQDKDRD